MKIISECGYYYYYTYVILCINLLVVVLLYVRNEITKNKLVFFLYSVSKISRKSYVGVQLYVYNL